MGKWNKFKWRIKTNESRIDTALDKLDIYGTDRQIASKIIQGKSGLNTKATLKRVNKILKQIGKGQFNFARTFLNQEKGVKDLLEQNSLNYEEVAESPAKLVKLVNRSEFYFQEKGWEVDSVITQYNSKRNRLDSLQRKSQKAKNEFLEAEENISNTYNKFLGKSSDKTATLKDF